MVAWNAPRVKVQLRLAIQRLKTLQEKKASIAKAARRDIATLLERGKVETARIKTESIINEDIHIELLELLELYCEIISTRFGLVENTNSREPDPGVNEAVIAIVYAAHRTEVKELHYVRESFMHRYGRDWSVVVMENFGSCVSPRVLDRVPNETPSPALVDAYLTEIARGYNLDWMPPQSGQALNPPPVAPDVSEFSEPSSEKTESKSGTQVDPSNVTAAQAGTSVLAPSNKSASNAPNSMAPRSILRTASPSSSSSKPSDPPPYSGIKDNKKGADNEGDEDDDLLRRFAALSGKK